MVMRSSGAIREPSFSYGDSHAVGRLNRTSDETGHFFMNMAPELFQLTASQPCCPNSLVTVAKVCSEPLSFFFSPLGSASQNSFWVWHLSRQYSHFVIGYTWIREQ
jgi:hypothetical protein